MSVASRVLGFAPKAEREGICLDDAKPWCVTPSSDVQRFVRALSVLAPEGAVAYFEGTGDPRVAAFLGRFAVEPVVHMAVATVWPRPDFYHLPITSDLMEALARFLDESEVGFLCTHAHVYRDGAVLLQWHDAFGTAPMHLSRMISEDVVRTFAKAIGGTVR
jgi:hypothetical protein